MPRVRDGSRSRHKSAQTETAKKKKNISAKSRNFIRKSNLVERLLDAELERLDEALTGQAKVLIVDLAAGTRNTNDALHLGLGVGNERARSLLHVAGGSDMTESDGFHWSRWMNSKCRRENGKI